MKQEVNTTDTRPAAETSVRYTYTPKVDIWETAEAFVVEAEMPGVEEQNVDLKIENQTLYLLGRVTPANPSDHSPAYVEYEQGNYERSFTLSNAVDEEHIKATMKHGVLRLELPKREASKPRKIAVLGA